MGSLLPAWLHVQAPDGMLMSMMRFWHSSFQHRRRCKHVLYMCVGNGSGNEEMVEEEEEELRRALCASFMLGGAFC